MKERYELYRSGEQYYFNLKAPNNEAILTSERYTVKAGAENGIESVRKNSPHDSRYNRRTSTNDKHYFVLRGGNNEVLGTSELYSSAQAMEKGIQACKTYGPPAPVVDLTTAAAGGRY